MRLITCEHEGKVVLGSWIEEDRRLVNLKAAAERRASSQAPPFVSMLALIEAGEQAWDLARDLTALRPDEAVIETSNVRLLAPIPVPPQVRDFLCFEGHMIAGMKGMAAIAARRGPDAEERLREIAARREWPIPPVWYHKPVYYAANHLSISGPFEEIRRPEYCELFDYELEFAAVIGKAGRNVTPEDARNHIFGYTIYNDWSARDEQVVVMAGMLGPGKSKDFDQGVTLGPCIVTTDELTDPYALTMKARVNGEEWSSGSSSSMHHKFEDCIADVTRSQSLYPGEVIGSGTVATGCGLEQLRFLNDGDVVELEVSEIGVLRNRVWVST